jgi:hypothetical protein
MALTGSAMAATLLERIAWRLNFDYQFINNLLTTPNVVR